MEPPWLLPWRNMADAGSEQDWPPAIFEPQNHWDDPRSEVV